MMERGSLGSYTLANIIRSFVALDDIDSIQEIVDNSKDYTRELTNPKIIIAIHNDENKFYLLISDNGISMKPLTIFKASSNKMQRSGNDSIGYFHRGALNAFLSLKSNKIFEYTKEPGAEPMKMVIYQPYNMIEETLQMFKENHTGQEISNKINSEYIWGPFVKNCRGNGITDMHLQDSLNYFENIENIKEYKIGNKQGTTFVFEFDKNKTDLNDEVIDSYFKKLCYKRKNNQNIRYYKQGVLQENPVSNNNPYENNMVQ